MTRRRIAEALIRALRPRFDVVYTARSGLARGLRRRGGLGFLPGRPLTPEERWLRARAWTGQVVYDIGAWEGALTLFFARAVGAQGQVLAFEPNPGSAARLRENVGLNHFDNVRLFELALADTEGQAWLDVPQGVASRGRLTSHPAGAAVSVRQLDLLVAQAGLPPPDFVKIDVEGAELAVLRGGAATLARHRPDLLIEIHPQADASALRAFLAALGYDLRCVETRQAVPDRTDLPASDQTWHWAGQPGQRSQP